MPETGIKKRIMLHIIMPDQISGPNTAARLIADSYLSEKYEFAFVEQRFHAGGRLNLRLIRDLYRQISAFDPQLVHLSGLQSSGFHAVIAAKLARKKVLLAVRGFSVDDMTIRGPKRFIYGKVVEPLTLQLSDCVYTVCEAAKKRKEIQRFRRKVLDTIHNPAPIINPEKLAERVPMRSRLGFQPEEIAVVISGRMTKDKGIPVIIEAIQSQRGLSSFKRCRYVFIGDGPMLENLEIQLCDEIRSGKVLCIGKKKEVLPFLMACDVFLFATLHENLSNALLEGMACGLPVIATAVGGNVEVVRNNQNGFLIPPNDSSAINSALLALLSNDTMRKEFGTKSKIIIEESFSQAMVLQMVEKAYKSLLL